MYHECKNKNHSPTYEGSYIHRHFPPSCCHPGYCTFFHVWTGQKKSTSADAKSRYKPGIYTSSIDLNENTFDLEVTVDSDRVTSIRLVNLSESTAAMFPLMEPALESLASQIYTSQSLENIQYSEDQKYTSMILLNAIETALKKAENN